MPYTFDEHIHNYAVWTAARAVNRDFAKTEVIREAIESSGMLADYVKNPVYDSSEFEQWHLKCATSLIDFFENTKSPCSYGRAAKIIAIYLKTALVLRLESDDPRSLVIHPPIDRLLLTNLAKSLKNLYPEHVAKKDELLSSTWTTLTEKEYWDLVKLIGSIDAPMNWQLEKHWKV